MNGPASQPSEMWPIRNCFVVVDIAWRWPIDLQKWDMLLAMFHTTCLSCTFDCIGPVSRRRPFDCFQMSRARRPLMDGRTLMRGAREKHADKRRLLLAGWPYGLLCGFKETRETFTSDEWLLKSSSFSSASPPPKSSNLNLLGAVSCAKVTLLWWWWRWSGDDHGLVHLIIINTALAGWLVGFYCYLVDQRTTTLLLASVSSFIPLNRQYNKHEFKSVRGSVSYCASCASSRRRGRDRESTWVLFDCYLVFAQLYV